MKMNKWILAGTALTGVFAAHGALAQSTASQEVEQVTEVVVTGQRALGPTKRERGPKAKTTIGQDTLSSAVPGQTFADTLNLVPGYIFTNNDAYGSSGGTFMVRGLESAKVSMTIDGVQVNDSGNYAVYTNQMIDSEFLCSVSVQTGATDVDSMTASATGGTINATTCLPEETFGGVVRLSVGQSDHRSGLIRLDTGRFGPFGTRAYIGYLATNTDTWTREAFDSTLEKKQINAMIHQEIGDKGSFISLAAHWNENRNNSIFGQTKTQIAQNGYKWSSVGPANINPSDTGNIRIKSKWVLTDQLTLTVDPSFQYTMANGGGTTGLSESSPQIMGKNYNAATPNAFFDINGNGVRDTSVSVYNPSNTHTQRYGVQTGLIYRFAETQLIRFNASFDRARHRQTGEGIVLNADGTTPNVFGGKEEHGLRIKTADGSIYQKRDRLSYADADVFSVEYAGRFLDDKLAVSIGLRHQTLQRELNQYCYSRTNGSGDVYCTTQVPTTSANTNDASIKKVTFFNMTSSGTPNEYISPFSTEIDFSKTMPNVGVTWNFDNGGQIFTTYAESMSSPRTDDYYSIVLRNNTVGVKNPVPETAQTFELGYRFNKQNFNATLTGFFAQDENRIVRAYDQETDSTQSTNVGGVDRKGIEAFANFAPVPELVISAGMTYTDTEVKDDLPLTTSTVLATKGKQLVGMPKWMGTFALDYTITPALSLKLDAKYVGDRHHTFVNTPGNIAPHYTLWNASMRYDLPWMKEGTYLQLNVANLFDKKYLHGSSFNNTTDAGINYQKGAPRTASLTLRTKF